MSTTDLIVNPRTGEALTLDSPTIDLARLVADLRDHKRQVDEMIRYVSPELLARLDKQAKWTEHLEGGIKIQAQSPAAAESEEFDAAALREELLALADTGVITVEAVDAAVETVVTYKPRAAGIKALRKLGGLVADVVARHSRPVERERRITVTRS